MRETVTASFIITIEQKDLLEQWAAEDDRSVSYVVRQILKVEAQRRKQIPTNQKQLKQRNAP
jgi:hypothetical protein